MPGSFLISSCPTSHCGNSLAPSGHWAGTLFALKWVRWFSKVGVEHSGDWLIFKEHEWKQEAPQPGKMPGLFDTDSLLRFEVLSMADCVHWACLSTGCSPPYEERQLVNVSSGGLVRDAPCHHQSPDMHSSLLFRPTYDFTLWALPFQKVGLSGTLIHFIFILE